MESGEPGGGGAQAAVQQTVVGLFEDTIDAEKALVALKKAHHDADRVSLMVRDKEAEAAGAEGAGAVARALVATALNAVGGWLHGLASLIVPERGTYLVAGPMGAALAGISTADVRPQGAGDASSYVAASDLNVDSLRRTLTEFGFAAEEATYLEHRLDAGAALVAVTSDEPPATQAIRRLFADHDAVYLGLAQTDTGFFEETEALLAAPPEASSGGDVVVADAVAPLVRVSQAGGSPEAVALCHRDVVDAHGHAVGLVEDVLAEPGDPHTTAGAEPPQTVARYLVIGFGGLLGLGRHRVAVPVPLADLTTDPIRLAADREVLRRGPAYNDDVPFSRREEQAVGGYFDVAPYWLPSEESTPTP
jgi:hypothetical protein